MATKTRPAFQAELLRPDDLLHLQVDGTNLRLTRDEELGPILTVDDSERPAFLRFTFAPQTIAESAFFEAAISQETSTPIQPENDPDRKDSDQGSTTHELLPLPGTNSESANTAARAAHRKATVAQIGHRSRLVFTVPPDAAIPFSFDGLLEWSKLELSVNGIAAIGDAPTAAQIANAPGIREPSVNETALELPYQLVISPTRDVAWLHRRQPFTSRGRTELWHTRLALKTAAGITELSKTELAPLRAIWSPDYDPNHLPPVVDDPELGRTAMCGNDRHQIVVLTSAFHGYELDRIVRARKKRPVTISAPYVPQPFHADRVMLSALGGWLRSRGQWDPPHRAQPAKARRPEFVEIFKNIDILRANPRLGVDNRALVEQQAAFIDAPVLFIQPERQQLDLSEWVHLATQGRDHYVKIVYEGELWPFRHPAALIKVTERKFKEANGIVGAYLMQRMFIVVRKPVMDFAVTDRGNLFKSVRLTTLVTPDIADPKLLTTNRTFWVEVMTSATTRGLFRFHAVSTDVEGNQVDFTVPLMFVSRSDTGNTTNEQKVVTAYNDPNAMFRAATVPGQRVAFAPKDPVKPTDTTQLVTDSLNFIMDAARVQPTLLKASVKIPQLQELLGTNQPTSIRLFPDYVANGADHPANATGVFAQIVDDAYKVFTPANPIATLGVQIAAEKAGGMATPNMAVTTLSRALGPLAGDVANAAKNNFDPTQFFPKGAAMLFGSFDLLDLFLPKPATPSGMTLDENAPKMRTERQDAPGGAKVIVTTIDWKPKFLEPSGTLDLGIAAITKDTGGVSVLEIKGRITKPVNPDALGGPPADGVSSEFAGSLNDFTVSVLASVFIQFKNFSFRKASNEKAVVAVQLDPNTPLRFGGDLIFIEAIRNAIPPGLFGDGPSLELIDNPLGIRAGFAFALPPLTVGVFTLKDVTLGAALTLPFLDGKPVFDFNISERPHPFLLAVGIFGGGGFFHLQLDTAGMKALEVALEFGATAALDIGVASGEVHIMAGIYFSLQRKEGSTDLAAILTGYLRLGGSLNVLGLISISVEFNLSFTYDGARDKAYGRATLTVSVHVLFFSASVELTVERAFGGSGDPHFIDFFPKAEPWEEYALAFA
ncbi:MAG: hypothetical protein ABI877_00710 [Gemmatimonadaceae bacterium]